MIDIALFNAGWVSGGSANAAVNRQGNTVPAGITVCGGYWSFRKTVRAVTLSALTGQVRAVENRLHHLEEGTFLSTTL
ncbi:hypothetical protein GCM10007171_05770 [Dickeya fangzhongdai]|nr:hypothetical protein GCM10007171_05770 [Dickeya fangzhongdai]